MKSVKIVLFSLLFSFSLSAAEQENQVSSGFISDDLFIYMHSGAGNNYRILGSINAGTEVHLTGKIENEYTQFINEKGREAWVPSKYISVQPGLRNVIAELNAKLASNSESTLSLENNLDENKVLIDNLRNENTQFKNEVATLNSQLIETKSKLRDQDTNIKKEWFFNGAIVLAIGLIFGLLIPRLGGTRKANMDSWK